jgi:hypothetical protein
MTMRHLLAASALALGLGAAASALAAPGVGDFVCQTNGMAKDAPPLTRCITWTREAREMMRAAPCDPAKLSVAEMRARCAELTAKSSPATLPTHG